MRKPVGGIKGAKAVLSSGRWGVMDRFAGRMFAPIQATGGDTITEIVQDGVRYRVHTFTATGSSSFVVSDVGTDGEVEYLVVAGGGAGGNSVGFLEGTGGGGAGGLLTNLGSSQFDVSSQTYSVVVGAGGSGTSGFGRGGSGGDSSLFGFTAVGGGGGGAGGDVTSGVSGGGARDDAVVR
jgi:hypothetical protein